MRRVWLCVVIFLMSIVLVSCKKEEEVVYLRNLELEKLSKLESKNERTKISGMQALEIVKNEYAKHFEKIFFSEANTTTYAFIDNRMQYYLALLDVSLKEDEGVDYYNIGLFSFNTDKTLNVYSNYYVSSTTGLISTKIDEDIKTLNYKNNDYGFMFDMLIEWEDAYTIYESDWEMEEEEGTEDFGTTDFNTAIEKKKQYKLLTFTQKESQDDKMFAIKLLKGKYSEKECKLGEKESYLGSGSKYTYILVRFDYGDDADAEKMEEGIKMIQETFTTLDVKNKK